MTSNFEKAVWVVAVLAFIPALALMSGFVVAAAIAVAILSLFYGGRYGLRVWEQQNVGKKAGRVDMNSTLNGGKDGKNWGRK